MLNLMMGLSGLSVPVSQPEPKDATMKKRSMSEPDLDEMPKEVDFSGGERGKYHKRFAAGDVHVVTLESDVADAFPTDKDVNTALRSVMRAKAKPRKRSKRA